MRQEWKELWVMARKSLMRRWTAFSRQENALKTGAEALSRTLRWSTLSDGQKHAVRAAMALLLVMVVVAFYRSVSATGSMETIDTGMETDPVICIGIARFQDGSREAFFQVAGDSIETTLLAQGSAEQVASGYVVDHRECFASWQAAADFITEGEVTLPEDAEEADFVIQMARWYQQRATQDSR